MKLNLELLAGVLDFIFVREDGTLMAEDSDSKVSFGGTESSDIYKVGLRSIIPLFWF